MKSLSRTSMMATPGVLARSREASCVLLMYFRLLIVGVDIFGGAVSAVAGESCCGCLEDVSRVKGFV